MYVYPRHHRSNQTIRTLQGRELIKADRTKRVKEARTEAQREIDEYRKQKEEEFKKFEAEVCPPPYTTLMSYANRWEMVGIAFKWQQKS